MRENDTVQPLVSVIIPVYNTAQYLERCLDSVIRQTYSHLEIICINDGSSDNSLSILKKYTQQDSRICVLSQQNRGQSSARNEGIKKSSGEYILFVDSDDELSPNCIETCYHYFNKNCDIISFSYIHINIHGIKTNYKPKYSGYTIFHEGIICNQPWNVWSYMFKSEIIKRYNMLFTENIIYEDLDFIARLFLVENPTVFYINDCLYFYYDNENSIMAKTRNNYAHTAIQHIYILDSIYEYLLKYGKFYDNMNDFIHICEYCFLSAWTNIHDSEQLLLFSEMTLRIKKYSIDYTKSKLLSSLVLGRYRIQFIDDIYPSLLKGWEKIFCIKKEKRCKVIRIFGKRIL